jgi:uncharacterized protein YmfQ (DUF2313 family)
VQGYTLRQQMQFLTTNFIAAKITFEEARKAFNREFVVMVIVANNGNQCKAARAMGMHRNTLTRWINLLGIDKAELRQLRHGCTVQNRKLYERVYNFEYQRRRPAMSASA